MPNQEPYCGNKIIQGIGNYYYENIYVYITVPICLVGMILNLLNVLVFTRKTMNSPPNLILAHLAFVDVLFLLSNIALLWIVPIQPTINGFEQKQSYSLTPLHFYIRIFLTTLQFISAFLTVQLAAWRYIAVVHPMKERRWCTRKITRNVMIIGYVICCVLYAIPYYLALEIETSSMNGKPSNKVTVRHPIMNLIRKYVYGVVMKVLASLILAVLTSRIVVALLARKTHREQLSPSASNRSDTKNFEMRQQTKRSTAILLAVAALFFVSEFPRGILWLLQMINYHGWKSCYYLLAPTFNTITNINTSITFMVYYTLSQQFRTTFKSLFNSNKRTISHQRRTTLVLGGTGKTESGRKMSEV